MRTPACTATSAATTWSMPEGRASTDVPQHIVPGATRAPGVQRTQPGKFASCGERYRGALDAQLVPDAPLDSRRTAADTQGAYIHALTDPDDLDDLLMPQVVLGRAGRAKSTGAAAYRRERDSRVHTGPAADGIPTSTLPVGTGRGSSARGFIAVADLSSGQLSSSDPDIRDDPPAADDDDDDAPLSWLRAGHALGRVLLQAASEGVTARPPGQSTELPGSRQRRRAALGLVGTPQPARRLGYQTGVARQTEEVFRG